MVRCNITPKATRKKKTVTKQVIKMRMETNLKNEINRKINKTKRWIFEKINKIDRSLARLSKEKNRDAKINKIRNEKREIETTIQRIISVANSCLLQGTICQLNGQPWKKWKNTWKTTSFQ